MAPLGSFKLAADRPPLLAVFELKFACPNSSIEAWFDMKLQPPGVQVGEMVGVGDMSAVDVGEPVGLAE
jgi:hypothetical protein